MDTHSLYSRRSYLQNIDSGYVQALACECVRNLYLILVTAIVFAITIIMDMSTVMANDSFVTEKPIMTTGAEQSEPSEPGAYKGDLRDLPKSQKWIPGDRVRKVPRKVMPQKLNSIEIQKLRKHVPSLNLQNLNLKGAFSTIHSTARPSAKISSER